MVQDRKSNIRVVDDIEGNVNAINIDQLVMVGAFLLCCVVASDNSGGGDASEQ